MGKKSAIAETFKFVMYAQHLKDEGMRFYVEDKELETINDIIEADNNGIEITIKNKDGKTFNKQKKVFE